MPSLDLRTVVANNPDTCMPPSLRRFGTMGFALADNPRAGDLYNIAGQPHWYDGATFLPVGRGDRIEIPDTAFADPSIPTVAEVDAYVLANFPDYTPGTLITFDAGGDYDSPDYVWVQDSTTLTTAIEIPAGSTPVAVIDLHDEQGNFVIHSSGHSSHVRTVGRTVTNYEWTVSEVGGGVLASISGAPDDDASGEFGVLDGTYEHPTWDTFNLCGDVEFCLQVTDNAGELSETTCEIIEDYGLVDLHFVVDDGELFTSNFGYVTPYVTEWDMGDGTQLAGNVINHQYTPGDGQHTAIATVCLPLARRIQAGNSGIINSFQDIFQNADMCDYPNLEEVDLRGNLIVGSMPNMSGCESLVTFNLSGNNLSGTIPGIFPPTLEEMVIAGNNISGSVPDLSSATSLILFNFERNNMTGQLPDPSNSPNLEIFNGSRNQFSGTSPDFSSNPALITVNLNRNNLTGSMPSFAANPALEELNYGSNSMTGTMPDFLNNPALRIFTMNNNGFSGATPQFNSTVMELFGINSQTSPFQGGLDEPPPDPNQWAGTLINYATFQSGYEGAYTDPVIPTLSVWQGGGVGGAGSDPTTAAFPDFTGSTAITFLRYYTAGGSTSSYTPGSLATGTAWQTIQIRLTGSTPADIDGILCDLDAGGVLGATLDVSGHNPPIAPTAVGLACAANLAGKGWTVQTD